MSILYPSCLLASESFADFNEIQYMTSPDKIEKKLKEVAASTGYIN
jgi:hypothetical protein